MNPLFKIKNTVRVQENSVFLNGEKIYVYHAGENENGMDLSSEPGTAFALACYHFLGISYPKFYKMDLMSKWGILSAELLLRNENTDTSDAYKRAIILQNSSSSLTTDRNFQQSIRTVPSPATFVYTLPNIVMGEMAIRYHFKGENTFFVVNGYDEAALTKYTEILFREKIAEVLIRGFLEVNEDQQRIMMQYCTAL